MPIPIPLALVTQKNLLRDADPWVLLVHLHLVKLGDDTTTADFYFCRNYEDVTFPPAGQVYTAFPFELSANRKNAKGRIERVSLDFSNVARSLQPTLEAYNGGTDSTVTISLVNTNNLSADHSALDMVFTVLNVTSDSKLVSMTLGASNPLRQRHPLYKYFFGHCRYVKHYTGAECRATSALLTCDGTLSNCVERENVNNFGGFPGMKSGAIQIASR